MHRTGLTVFLFDRPLTCAAHLCGSAPGTRDVLPFMQLGTWVDQADALLFTGGSAYGLDAAAGVMSYLREKGQGLKIPSGTVVPLVPAACIFDLGVGSPVFPSAQDAYQACQRATLNAPLEGKVGAGTGATVNKCWVDQAPKEGGFSTETLVQGELQISVYAVVNAVGGLASSDLASHTLRPEAFLRGQNTVLIAVFCNASFNQNELMMIAKMASGGIAQSIQPAFT
ncbi:MAG: peptidase S58 family protein, partial [Gammaproteobacteria bacterium]|nr:peptidase S58 family protein [Gammaproteobacteria bacterium]